MIPHCWGEWIAFRDDMDELEASLSIDHPELDWTDAMRPFKDEADTAIRTLTTANNGRGSYSAGLLDRTEICFVKLT